MMLRTPQTHDLSHFAATKSVRRIRLTSYSHLRGPHIEELPDFEHLEDA